MPTPPTFVALIEGIPVGISQWRLVRKYACNNALRADELRQEYVVLRQNYGGFPIIDNDHFDTEMVSKIIFDMKRGRAREPILATYNK